MTKRTKEISYYILASALIYVLLFSCIYLFIDILEMNESLGFFLAYLIAYPVAYLSQLAIFDSKGNKKSVLKFILHTVIFMTISNLFFNIFIYFNYHHFLATCLTILFTFPLRFLSSKLLVFRN